MSMYGVYRSSEMNIDVFPDVTAPTVAVLTEAHGFEAEEVEKLVTYQVETAMNGSPGVRRIRSSSASGISIVWVEFDWGVDIYRARQIVSERIPSVAQGLPEGVEVPTMAPISSIMGEIMLVAITAPTLTPMEIRTIADWTILPRLKSIQGVANVVVIGGDYKQYQVQVSPQKMQHYGVSIFDILKSAEKSTSSVSGGFFTEYGQEYLIKGAGRARSLEDLNTAVLENPTGKKLLLSDVANIQIGASDKIGNAALNDSPAVFLTVTKQPNANTLDLTAKLDVAVEEMQGALPDGVQLRNDIFRQSTFIENSIANLQETLWEGALCVVLVLFLFLMNWRTTIISLLAIPISLLASIIVLDALNYDINTMSLGGMAIAIGALVDDAIIDVENVYKRLRENWLRPLSERKLDLSVILNASIEIRSSIIIATLIILVSFVPLFFLEGMEGKLLKPLGIAFMVSVLASLVVAVTLTPVLCSLLLKETDTEKNRKTTLERKLENIYGKILDTVLVRPRIVLATTVMIFLFSIALVPQLGRSFLPEFNEGSFMIAAIGIPGMSLDQSNKVGSILEKELLSMPEIEVVARRTGRAELDEHAQGVNASELDVPFTLSGRTKDEFVHALRQKLSLIPGVNISVGQPIAHRIDHMLSGTNANIAIKIFGPELPKLFSLGMQIQSSIEDIDGIADVIVDQQINVPQIRIEPNRAVLMHHNMSVESLMHQVDILFAGELAGNIYEGQKYFSLTVRLEEEARVHLDLLGQVPIVLPNGDMLPLNKLATVSSMTTPSTISRENVQRKIVVAANVAGRDLRSVVEEIKSIIKDDITVPEGYRIEYGGQFESEAKASQLLLGTALIAVLVILGLLYVEFKNIRLASVVLFNLPLALIGGIIIVYFTSGIVSIASMIGFISLFGIATRNGILLISRYEDLRKEGVSQLERLRIGALDRLNPILMTACTTGLALIPLVLKGGEAGNEIQSPMALVILGGLFSATLLNLVVIPCLMRLQKD